MKLLIVFVSYLVLSVSGAPYIPLVYSAPVLQTIPVASQWHSQSGVGDYSYGYQSGLSAKSEIKTLDGITQGSYSYIDAENKLQTVHYLSDAVNGFRVAATNLPSSPVDSGKPPQQIEDTPEVKAAKLKHLEVIQAAENNADSTAEQSYSLKAPEPVEDTSEVKQAREEHLKAVELAKIRNADDIQTVEPATIAVHSPLIIPSAVHVTSNAKLLAAQPFTYIIA